ncbi:MAG: iron ABC transporter permease [Candidatus Hydrogenedentes bacterium]|nr:iron ABC transporter permease [Candidatus Hydrogenedentota bacterium]
MSRPGLRGHRILTIALAVPLLLPPYIVAMTWVDLLGTNGLLRSVFATTPADLGAPGSPPFNLYNTGGVILVLALTYFPLSAGCTAIAWRRVDGTAVEAARVYGGLARTFWRTQLPLAAPGILAGILAVFLLGLLSFAVPSLLQVQVYTVEIYTRFSSFFDTSGAMAQALPLLALGLATVLLLQRHLRRATAASTTPRPCRVPMPRGLHATAITYSMLLALGAGALPIAVVAWRAGTPAEILTAWRSAGDEVLTSLLLSTAAATATVFLALAMGCIERDLPPRSQVVLSARSQVVLGNALAQEAALRLPRRLFSASAVPFLVSGPVLGVGLIHLWNHAPLLSLVYDSAAILVLACTARYLVFAHLGLRAALAQLGARPEEAAAVCGAGPLRRVTQILLPLLSPALIVLWAIVFILSLGELDTVLLVAPPGWTPLSVRVFSLLHYGPSQAVAALCLLTLLIMLLAAGLCAVAYALLRRGLHVRA